MFEIKIEGVEELKAAIAAGAQQLVKDVRQAAAHSAQVATRQIKALAPVKTGDLRKSVEPHLRPTPNGSIGNITVGEDYASHVVDGTKPHRIEAKNAKALRFEVGGRVMLRRAVQHPGTKPNDFVTPGVTEGQQVLDHDAAQAVAKLKRTIEG